MTGGAEADRRFMAVALGLARRGLGTVWPNPAVGCVLVRGGHIVGRGWTGRGGRPHAETEALAHAGSRARGAVCYVSLEPCAHHGMTSPCAEALIAAGIERAVVALEDPDPRVSGGGVAMLEAAGIAVARGCMAAEARALNAGFLSRIERGRPLVTVKTAASLDGRIATRAGESRWITAAPARAYGHLLRATHDAVLVGAGTAGADNPALTCRLPGMEGASPVRIVLDGAAALPEGLALLADARTHPTWIVSTAMRLADGRGDAYRGAGAEIVEAAAEGDGRPGLASGLEAVAARGITRLLVEGGGSVAGALLRAGLVDRMVWLRAPSPIGGDGIPALAPLGVERIGDVPPFVRVSSRSWGPDLLETLVPAP